MKGNRLWKSSFISYLFILIIPLVVASLIYFQSYKLLTTNIYEENEKLVENCAEIIDIEILNVDNIVDYFSSNLDINVFTTLTKGTFTQSSQYYKVIKASYPIHSFPINQTMLYDILVYSNLNDSIISSSRVHTEIEREYDHFLKWEDLSFDQWKSNILNKFYYREFLPEVNIASADGHYKKVLPYISAIPLNSKGHSKGSIIAYLDLEKFQKILSKINRGDNSKAYIFDEENNLLTSAGSLEEDIDIISLLNNERSNIQVKKINHKKYFISQNTSVLTGFKIISILPTSFISEQLLYIKVICLSVLISTLICGLILALYFSYKRTKPIIEIAEIAKVNLDENTKKINTLDMIRENLNTLIEDNKSLADYRDKQVEQNRNLFLERLLQGNISSDSNFKQQLDYYKLNFDSSYFNVLLINILGYGTLENEELLLEKDLIKLIIVDNIEKNTEFDGIFYMHENNQLVYILKEEPKKNVEQSINFIISKLSKENNINIIVSLGKSCEDISNISFSYGQAVYAMDYLKKNLVIKYINYAQISDYKDIVYYPLEIENKIIQLTLQGLVDQVDLLFDLIYEENIVNKNLSDQMKDQLISNYISTFNRIVSREELDYSFFEIHQKIKRFNEIEEKIAYVKSLIVEIAKNNNKKIEDDDKKLIKSLKDFIEINYSDSTLNLSVLSQEFNYKESFIYHFFINNMNISFSAFLENVRMEKAKELLTTTNLSIIDISKNCGYSSSHSFRRAFKRVCSINPSDYKNSI